MAETNRGLDVRFESSEGPVVVARLLAAGGGSVAVHVTDERYREGVEQLLSQGVASSSLRRRVGPGEGQLYLDAVAETLGRSAYWSVVATSAA